MAMRATPGQTLEEVAAECGMTDRDPVVDLAGDGAIFGHRFAEGLIVRRLIDANGCRGGQGSAPKMVVRLPDPEGIPQWQSSRELRSHPGGVHRAGRLVRADPGRVVQVDFPAPDEDMPDGLGFSRG